MGLLQRWKGAFADHAKKNTLHASMQTTPTTVNQALLAAAVQASLL